MFGGPITTFSNYLKNGTVKQQPKIIVVELQKCGMITLILLLLLLLLLRLLPAFVELFYFSRDYSRLDRVPMAPKKNIWKMLVQDYFTEVMPCLSSKQQCKSAEK